MSLHHCWPEYFCIARFNLYVILDNTLSQIFEKHPRGGGLGTYVGATRPALAPPSIRCCCRGCRACRALSGVGTVGTVGTVGVSLTVHARGHCREIYYSLSGLSGYCRGCRVSGLSGLSSGCRDHVGCECRSVGPGLSSLLHLSSHVTRDAQTLELGTATYIDTHHENHRYIRQHGRLLSYKTRHSTQVSPPGRPVRGTATPAQGYAQKTSRCVLFRRRDRRAGLLRRRAHLLLV